MNDLDFYAEKTSERKITSIFFGGGTPSLIHPKNIENILGHIAKRWHLDSQIEISLEANPNTEYPNMFSELKKVGINRLSLGVQALNEKDLKFLGRTHTLKEAYHSIDNVLKTFSNNSMDIIYARPNQTLSEWQEELRQITSLGFKHLSLYQLTIEEGTIFAKKGIKNLEEKKASKLYTFTKQFLKFSGYRQYEVSNYANKGFECKHNLIYWQGDDYIGIGPSAHGRIKLNNKFYALTYPRQQEQLSAIERAEELLLMGLRLSSGIDKNKFKQICNIELDNFINSDACKELCSKKLLINTQKTLRPSAKGLLFLDYIIKELCP